jgi:hypothetical protein
VNKFLLLFWLLFSISNWAQETLTVSEKDSLALLEKKCKVDQVPMEKSAGMAPDFKSKYKEKEFQYEVKLSDKSLWDRFKEWLAYWFKKIFGISDAKVSSDYVEITLKVIAGLIVIYVVYLIVKVILNKEGQWVFGKSTTKKIIHDDDIEKNLVHVDFEKLLKQTLKENNHRLAIRYYYLWTLKKLSERNIIEWHVDKTNTDYLYEIQSKELKDNFQYLSYLYNYIWYGEFEMNETTFNQAQKAFEKTLQSIR